MLSLRINNTIFLVKENISILDACKYVGINIPRFCYHEILSISGNCRMCLVELDGVEKPVASCVTLVEEGMSVWVDTSFVKKAREGVLEALLLNHPLDCPICDQGGECDLQDQSKVVGSISSKFFFNKRAVVDKDCGPLIKTIMTRCIHCTRCVRFSDEIAGISSLGVLNRGSSTEIGMYISKMFDSEISGTVIDLCPVGALTSKPYSFKARPWELRLGETVDLNDSSGSSVYVSYRGGEILRITPKNSVNDIIISDKARFSCDSLNNNRIKTLSKRGTFLQESISWFYFFNSLKIIFLKNKVTVFFNEEIGYKNLTFLKNLSYLNLNCSFNTACLLGKDVKNNYFFSGITGSLSDVLKSDKICFLLSFNPKIESSIINSKLQLKSKNDVFTCYSVGQTFVSNVPTSFISLNILNFILNFEGKNLNVSKKLLLSSSPLIVFGKSLNFRFKKIDVLIKFFKKNFINAKILSVGLFSNTEGVEFLNPTKINSKLLLKSKVFFNVNLDDILFVRKILFKKNFLSLWLNTHLSTQSLRSDYTIPLLSGFESEEIHLNFEQKPQKSQKIFSNFFEAKSLSNFFFAFFNIKINDLKRNVYDLYFEELISSPRNFSYSKENFILFHVYKNCHKLNNSFVSKYFIKAGLEDFYCSNNFTKNSVVMQQCSQKKRHSYKNFI
jgi:NADH-quinone oxidoreductase subunit G